MSLSLINNNNKRYYKGGGGVIILLTLIITYSIIMMMGSTYNNSNNNNQYHQQQHSNFIIPSSSSLSSLSSSNIFLQPRSIKNPSLSSSITTSTTTSTTATTRGLLLLLSYSIIGIIVLFSGIIYLINNNSKRYKSRGLLITNNYNRINNNNNPLKIKALTAPKPFSLILLSGGKGKRMNNKNKLPKQYIPLIDGRSSVIRAFDTFITHPLTRQIIIVCREEFKPIFKEHIINNYINNIKDVNKITELIIPYIVDDDDDDDEPPMLFIEGKYKDIPKRIVRIAFAHEGEERQDSVRNGINKLRYVVPSSSICIHDAARPLIRKDSITRTALEACKRDGVAVLAVKAKATIKKVKVEQQEKRGKNNDNNNNGIIVDFTPNRDTMWEAQTPQILPYGILKDGLDLLNKSDNNNNNKKLVTDDVSLIEILHNNNMYKNINVAVANGDYDNIKLTTPDDLIFCNSRIEQLEEE